MKKFEKILAGLKNKSPLPLLFENGHTPETIKQEIATSFSPYFTNKSNLEKYSIIYMVSDWVNYLRIGNIYPNIYDDIKTVLSAYNTSKTNNPDLTVSVIAQLMPYHIDTGNKFWSFVNLEVTKSDLAFEEFVQTSMKDMSDVVEGLTKIFFIEQLLINRIIRGRDFDLSKILDYKLGNLVDELLTTSKYPTLFTTKPDNIKLSDWRNIASHNDYVINNDIVLCTYGKGENKKSISLNKTELYDRVQQCVRTMEILNMAHKLFSFDNMDAIIKVYKPTTKELRDEIGFLTMSSSIMSQGFEIIDIDYKNKTEATLVVRDLTNEEPIRRGIHSSQFLISLWLFTKSAKLSVKYKTLNDDLFLTSRCDGKTCELISTSQRDIAYLAEKVEIERYTNTVK